jgi:hypothetical protein
MTRREPSWTRLDHAQRMAASDADLARWEAEAIELDAEAATQYRDRRVLYEAVVDLAGRLWPAPFPSHRAVYNVLRRHKPVDCSGHWRSVVARMGTEIRAHRVRVTDEKARTDKAARLAAAAVLWLAARGQQPGTDYEPADAVKMADGIAFNEEVARLRAEAPWRPFGGDDECDASCRGWDGDDYRCDCGTRRVQWNSDHHTFNRPSIFPETW